MPHESHHQCPHVDNSRNYLLPFLYGPVFYTYARSVSADGISLPRDARWHFLPLVILALVFVPFYLQSAADKIAMRERLAVADVPEPFKGAAIGMITAGLMSLAFMGFAGLV